MDPKSSSQLDPKLQEAYNRVMGVQIPDPTQPIPTEPSFPQPTPTATPIDTPVVQTSTIQPTAATIPSTLEPVVTPITQQITSQEIPSATIASQAPIPVTTTSTPEQIQQPSPIIETPSPLSSTPPMESMENTASIKPHTFVAKKGMDLKISPVILVVGAVAFLAVYTLIWVKVFNLSIPFINQ